MGAPTLRIPDELFAVSESSSFSGLYDPGELQFGRDLYQAPEPLSWTVQLTNTGKELMMLGSVTGELVTSCARCLEPYAMEVSGEVEGMLILPWMADSVTDDLSEDEFLILGDDLTLDLEPFLKSALHLEVPVVPLCKEDCRGICPGCGANLNEEPCTCPDERDSAPDPANPFSVLADLSLSDEEPSSN